MLRNNGENFIEFRGKNVTCRLIDCALKIEKIVSKTNVDTWKDSRVILWNEYSIDWITNFGLVRLLEKYGNGKIDCKVWTLCYERSARLDKSNKIYYDYNFVKL